MFPRSLLQIFLASVKIHCRFSEHNKSWGVFRLILDHCPRANCIKYPGQRQPSPSQKSVRFDLFTNILLSALQLLKETVLRRQYLVLLEEITHFMQRLSLKEINAWLKCFLSETENGFGEAYSSKSALKGCHVVWRRPRQSKGVCAAKPLSTATIGDAILSASFHQALCYREIHTALVDDNTAWDGSALGGPSPQSILEDLNELRSTGDQWDCL